MAQLAGLLSVAVAAGEPLLSPPLDYGRSVITTLGGSGNAPLFWLESRCRITDPTAKVVRDYWQCGSCKSEHTFASEDLFMTPNYDFLPVFTEGQTVVFRRPASFSETYRRVTASLWGGTVPHLRPAKARVLADAAQVASAVAQGLPLIGQVELRHPESGRTALLEFPIKTMNVGIDGQRWQVDTGPVVLPDLAAPPEGWSEGLRLAFVAYNTWDWADFVVEAPTPLSVDGSEVARVHHYSETLHCLSRNQVLALDLDEATPPPAVTEEDGLTKIGLLAPGPGNPRNSEGALLRLADGRVMLVYTHFTGGGGDHAAAFLAARFSQDAGRTWTTTDTPVLANEGGMNVMSVSLLRLRSGEMALFYLRKNAEDDCRAYLRRSLDEGVSWSEPVLCIPSLGYFVVNNDRVIQLESGRLVVPAARHSVPGGRFGPGVALCFLSDDEGQTWRQSTAELQGPPGCRSGLQEPGVIELRDGRLMMLCRTDLGCQYRSYSADGGGTWSPAEPTEILSPCSPATFKRVPGSNDILMVWNDHSGDPALAQKRTPLVAAVSSDEGLTWHAPRMVEADPDGWFCYTAMEFVGDQVLLAYCATGKGQPHLSRTQVTRFRLDWLNR